MATAVAQPPPRQYATSPSQHNSTTDPITTDNGRPRELPRTWEIPPKPKPGRKPNNDVPADKKRASNRTAQRRFRERKKQKVEHMQEEMDRMRSQQRQEAIEHAERMMRAEQKAREERLSFERELQAAREAEAEARRALKLQEEERAQHVRDTQDRSGHAPRRNADTSPPSVHPSRPPLSTSGGCPRPALSRHPSSDQTYGLPTPSSSRSSVGGSLSPGSILPLPLHNPGSLPPYPHQNAGTAEGYVHPYLENIVRNLPQPNVPEQKQSSPPPVFNVEDMEIDFTTKRSVPVDDDIGSTGTPSGDPCGFCNEGTYCVCKGSAPSPLEPPTTASGPQPILPGTCDTCMRDPEQRRICMDIASRHPPTEWRGSFFDTNKTAETIPLTSSANAELVSNDYVGDLPTLARRTTTCADAIAMARNGDESFAERPGYTQWLDSVRTAPPLPDRECNSCNDTNCSAQDIEIASIMSREMREERRFIGEHE